MIAADALVRPRVHERHGGICNLCGKPVPVDLMHLDHVVPLSRGGHDTESNLQPTHPRCNTSKGTLHHGLRSNQLRTATNDKLVRFVLRLPPELHEALKKWAEREERSLHAQILYILRRAIREWMD